MKRALTSGVQMAIYGWTLGMVSSLTVAALVGCGGDGEGSPLARPEKGDGSHPGKGGEDGACQLDSSCGEGGGGTAGGGETSGRGGTAGRGGSAAEGGAAGESGTAGERGEKDEGRALELLTTAVEAQLGSAAPVTKADALIGQSYALSSYLGPSEDWDGPPGGEDFPALFARATVAVVEDDDGLTLVSSLPSEVFSYAERRSLEPRGDAWVVRGLTTSIHNAWTSDGLYTTAFYESALAVIAFTEDGRVAIAATNGYDGDTPRDDDSDVIERGTYSGLATSSGQLVPIPRQVKANDVAHVLSTGHALGFGSLHLSLFNDRALLALDPPVNRGSVFHFENAEGARAQAELFDSGGFVVAVASKDYLPEGWKMVGSGTALDGKRFSLSKAVDVVFETRIEDIEKEGDWRPCPLGNYDNGELLDEYEGVTPLAGARSLLLSGCARFRVARKEGATELAVDAVDPDCCTPPGESSEIRAQITALGPDGASTSESYALTSAELKTATFPLPAGDGDVLVELRTRSYVWLDSLRTE